MQEDIEVKLAYLTVELRNKLILVWDIKVDLADDWYHAHVDTHTSNVVSLINWVSHSTFNVFPVGINDPGNLIVI